MGGGLKRRDKSSIKRTDRRATPRGKNGSRRGRPGGGRGLIGREEKDERKGGRALPEAQFSLYFFYFWWSDCI